jgi:hypothetical protein
MAMKWIRINSGNVLINSVRPEPFGFAQDRLVEALLVQRIYFATSCVHGSTGHS